MLETYDKFELSQYKELSLHDRINQKQCDFIQVNAIHYDIEGELCKEMSKKLCKVDLKEFSYRINRYLLQGKPYNS